MGNQRKPDRSFESSLMVSADIAPKRFSPKKGKHEAFATKLKERKNGNNEEAKFFTIFRWVTFGRLYVWRDMFQLRH